MEDKCIFLYRVSSSANVKKNCMPASNLGIVFGPTLLRRRYVFYFMKYALYPAQSMKLSHMSVIVDHCHASVFVE